MENLTELLKKSTIIKNESGFQSAITFLKDLIVDENLLDGDATRCSKKIISFLKHVKPISFTEVDNYFEKILTDRILDVSAKYELFYSLCEFYFDQKQFDLALQMLNGATESTYPEEYEYLRKLRNCFDKRAQISRVSITNDTKKSIEYLSHITSACILEIASEINYSLADNLRFYFDHRKDDFSENIYLNDEDGYYDSALKSLGLLDKKKEIIEKIHTFATHDIPEKMGFSEKQLSGKNFSGIESICPFNDTQMILNFVKTVYDI